MLRKSNKQANLQNQEIEKISYAPTERKILRLPSTAFEFLIPEVSKL